MLALALLIIASSADAKTEARALLDEGNAHFSASRFERALEKYEAAYQLYESPKILLNMAETKRAQRRAAEAINLYERALEPGTFPQEVQAQVKARIAELDPEVGRIIVLCETEGATATVDDQTTQLARAVAVSPGFHEVEVQAKGFQPFQQSVKVEVGARVEVPAQLEVVSLSSSIGSGRSNTVTAQTNTKDPPLVTRWWLWAGVAAVVVLGVGLGVGLGTRGGDDFVPMGELGRTRTDQWTSF